METDGGPVWVSHHPNSIVRIRTRVGKATWICTQKDNIIFWIHSELGDCIFHICNWWWITSQSKYTTSLTMQYHSLKKWHVKAFCCSFAVSGTSMGSSGSYSTSKEGKCIKLPFRIAIGTLFGNTRCGGRHGQTEQGPCGFVVFGLHIIILKVYCYAVHNPKLFGLMCISILSCHLRTVTFLVVGLSFTS